MLVDDQLIYSRQLNDPYIRLSNLHIVTDKIHKFILEKKGQLTKN
jgi:hypothetical protein